MCLQDIKNAFLTKVETRNKIKDKIKLKQEQIIRLERKLYSEKYDDSWIEHYILPIVDILKERHPQVTFEQRYPTPLGLRSGASVYGAKNNGSDERFLITFTIGKYDEGQLSFDEPNTRGNHNEDPHGFSATTTLLTDISQLDKFFF